MLSALTLKNLLKIPFVLLACTSLVITDSTIHQEQQERREVLECIGAQAFCSEQIYTFSNSVNTFAPEGPNYGCLSSSENPIWYYMQVGQAGTIQLKISQTTNPNGQGRQLDVDFTMWGPFDTYENGCRSIMQGASPIQSSYSADTVEYIGIGVPGGSNSNCSGRSGLTTPPSAQEGEIYIILLTNYSGYQGFITFNQESGTGSANCEIVNPCSFSEVTATASCNGNLINYSGSISFTDAPDEGTLTVKAENGGSQIFNAPFASPIEYSFSGPNNDSQETNISVSFSADECTKVQAVNVTNYILPTFTITDSVCLGSDSFTLPTVSNEGITGTWDKTVNTLITETYTFVPSTNQCALPVTKTIIVKEKAIVELTTQSNQICTGTTFNAQLTSSQNNVEYFWTVEVNNVTGAQPGRGSSISNQLFTNNPFGGQVKYTIIPSKDGCQGEIFEYIVNVLPKPNAFAPSSLEICSNSEANISLSSSFEGIIYNYRVEQINATGALPGEGNEIIQNLVATTTIPGNVKYYITPILNGCEGDEILVNVTVNPITNITINEGYLCFDSKGKLNNTLVLNPGNLTGYDIQWYKNQEIIVGANQNNYTVLEPGYYFLEATNRTTGCKSISNEVEIKDGAYLHQSEIYVENSLENGKVTVESFGNGDYVYSLNNGVFSSQNIYSNLSIGEHQIEVKDLNGCYYKKIYFTIFSYPNFFTPNGDGINDTWNIWALKDQADAEIFIFDRTGKLLKQITPRGAGWDGTYNNIPLPSSDYWFKVNYRDGKDNNWREYKSHFSLKR